MTRLSEFFEPRWQINRTRGGGRRIIQSTEGRRGAEGQSLDVWREGRGTGVGHLVRLSPWPDSPSKQFQPGWIAGPPSWCWRIVWWCYKNTYIGIGIRIVGIFNSIIFIASCLLTWIFKAMNFSLRSVDSAVLFLVYLDIPNVGFDFFFNLNVA